jgi:hypothetical protein
MSAFSTIILVCSINLSHGDCRPDTAIDVIRGAGADSVMMCAMTGQTTLAATALAPVEGEEYTKIMCVSNERADKMLQAKVRIAPAD